MTHRLARNALVGLAVSRPSPSPYFGERIVAHPGRYLIGYGRDPQIFVWSFAWWLHALETWQNPFYSHAIYAPVGINLAWATTVPGLALLFAPVTALFGPDVSYNLAAMLVPALSAFTAYLLCRHVTRSTWASLVGGYLFGFSSYMLGQEQGHLHMTSVFLVPLIALATIRYLQGELDGRGFGVAPRRPLRPAVLALDRDRRHGGARARGRARARLLRSSRRPGRGSAGSGARSSAAIGLAAVVAAPLLYYLVTGFQSRSINTPSAFDGDLLELRCCRRS